MNRPARSDAFKSGRQPPARLLRRSLYIRNTTPGNSLGRLALLLFLLLFWGTTAAVSAQQSPLFERDVLPILQQSCLACHSGNTPAAGLDLGSSDSLWKGSATGPVIVQNASQDSVLFQKISRQKMPPQGAGSPLSASQIEVIRRWIDSGTPSEAETRRSAAPPVSDLKSLASTDSEISLEDRSFWAFLSPVKVQMPKTRNAARVRTPVDAFLMQKLEIEGLTFSPPASKTALIRRAYFDLLGLPPSLEQVEEFLGDGRPDAYERLIDHLLESPHYGERWGRHWLDAVGYTDEYSIANDGPIYKISENIWRYRDYVVRSFNQDKPFDRFLTEQLAGDELYDWRAAPKFTPEILDGLIATGYLRTRQDDTDQQELNTPREHFLILSQLVDNLGSGLLGLTVGCARCHDHKYDPIQQADYYRLMAIFATSFNPEAWTTVKKRNLPDVSQAQLEEIERHNAEIDRPLTALLRRLDKIRGPHHKSLYEAKLASVPELLREDVSLALETPVEQRNQVQKYFAAKLEKELEVLPKEVDALLDEKEQAESAKLQERIDTLKSWRRSHGRIEAVWDAGKIPEIRLLHRGELTTPGAVVQPGVPAILSRPGEARLQRPPDTKGDSSGRRLALARWLIRPDHPLTARVMVNRIWMHHFGKGIVETAGNFGRQGSPPTHPELLDWLAVDFVEHDWKTKRLHKMIMGSSAYRQSSRRTSEATHSAGEEKDPANRLLWRMNLRRLEAEVIRDSMLVVSGNLDSTMGGKSVMVDLASDGLVTAREPSRPSAGQRRSLYLLARRNYMSSFLETFDFPIIQLNCSGRTQSATPLQSLTQLNSEFSMQQSERFAERVDRLTNGEAPIQKKVKVAFGLAFSRQPSPDELKLAEGYFGRQRQRYLDLGTPAREASRRALAGLCQMLMAASEFLHVG